MGFHPYDDAKPRDQQVKWRYYWLGHFLWFMIYVMPWLILAYSIIKWLYPYLKEFIEEL